VEEEKKTGAAVDMMTLLSEEVERMVARAGKTAFEAGEAETQAFLAQYEQKAKQVILKVREEMRVEADALANRFREALVLRMEQSSALALSETVAAVSARTDEIVRRLQDAARREMRQVLAEELGAKAQTPAHPEAARSEPAHPAPARSEAVPPAAKPAEPVASASINSDFETWLNQ
jgi:hypothetical protein